MYKLKKSKLLLLFFLILLVFLSSFFLLPYLRQKFLTLSGPTLPTNQQSANKPQTKDSPVLGIYISSSENGYSYGGLVTLASTDEPAVEINGYNLNGEAEISMYEADESILIDYLTHDKDGKQTKKSPDVSKLKLVTTTKQQIVNASYNGTKVPLPFKGAGIWFLKVKTGPSVTDAFVIRSDIGVLTKEGDNELIFWGQNFKNGRSITGGTVKTINLQDNPKTLQTSGFSTEGIAKTPISADADIALISSGNDIAIVPINLKYLNTGYSYKEFQPKPRRTRYFTYTDRPLYKPGDTVYFKSVIRDDDDARYTIPTDTVDIKIYEGYDDKNPLLEKNFAISPDGTINGEYKLPDDIKVGSYTLSIQTPSQKTDRDYRDYEWSSNTVSFDVEYYRKPEFTIDVAASKTLLIAGDNNSSFKIGGSYFSGQPLIGQKVKYTVYSSDFYEYEFLTDKQNTALTDDYRYHYWYGSNKVTEGTSTLDAKGEAEVKLNTKMSFNKGKSQIFSIEATLDDGSQNPAFSRKNILVYAGEYGIYRKDFSYGTKINTPLSLPVSLQPNAASLNVSGIDLTAKVHLTNWEVYQEPDKKYSSYRKVEEDLPNLTAKTDNQGNAAFSFTPQKTGYYSITVEGKDSRGNTISKIFSSYVTAEDQPYYSAGESGNISIAVDKLKYLPTDTVKFDIFSQIPDRDIFLSLERGRVNDYQIIHLNGKNAKFNIPLVNTDIPNIFAKVSSFSNSTLDSHETNIIVSSDSKKLNVNITPNAKTFGPGETVTVNLSTTDSAGSPVSADLALWTVDKAIFELSDNKLGNIFETFWDKRYNSTREAHSLEGISVQRAEMGGCFAEGTKILTPAGLKNIEDVKAGDYILTRSETDPKLVKARVQRTENVEEEGYMILNGHLKVTPNHILRINNAWKEAGSAQAGDILIDDRGKKLKVTSVEWQQGKTKVYNLEIEKYHTFFADGVWVHNDKGMSRNAFKDMAYWNPSIHTDSSGRARVTFKLPDNLTTWTLAAVGSTQATMVGQATTEIVATKDIIVRPIIPNILRTGDEIILSALVQNFTQKDHNFDIGLKFDAGSVGKANYQEQPVKSNQMEQYFWNVLPGQEKEKSKLTFSATAKDDKELGDIVTAEIPVRAFGFMDKQAESGEGKKDFALKLATDSSKLKSSVTLSLSPTIIGSLPTAMKYLINYPYGCVEQTTSRFVPAVIAKVNKDLFTEALADKDIDAVIQKGLSRLATLQQYDGGWTWWFTGNSDPFITAYVIEYLLQAQQSGIQVNPDILNKAKDYLLQEKTYTGDEQISRYYGLTLLGEKSKVKQISDFNGLSPDLLSIAIITNYLNGNRNPESNGLSLLNSMAQTEGSMVFWNAGSKANFGSRDASTAWAIRAILTAGGDRNLAVKGAKFLMGNRRFDYWSNTYATAQVVRALVDLSKTGNELTPNYTYTVSLDNKQITQGAVTDAKLNIKDINITLPKIKPEGSTLTVDKTGDGQLYSTLVVNEYRTDKNIQAADHGLYVKRQYESEKGPDYTLAVGDTVLVKITVGGLKADENYGIISDELPSGLVPINESFKNEQYGNPNLEGPNYSSYDITDREITENGINLSLFNVPSGERTYTYRARVVSQGTFLTPPVTVSLMYSPEIYGRSAPQTVVIGKESVFTGKKKPGTSPGLPFIKTLGQKEIIFGAGLLVLIIIAGLFLAKKKLMKKDDLPPAPPKPNV